MHNSDAESLYLKLVDERDRKRLGQVFTPPYIIRFMLHQIEVLDFWKNSSSHQQYKILDPACGAGRFLVEIYDFMREKLRNIGWNDENIHRWLLSKCLYGMDIEPLAVEFTKFALTIKKRECNVAELLITNGNILVQELNPSDMSIKLENFDLVIGNPPYFLISMKGNRSERGNRFHTTYIQDNLQKQYQNDYRSWPERSQDPNIFYLFIERGIQLLKEGGFLCFIIPDIILAGQTTKNLRKVILETCCIKKIITVEGRVFEEKGISNIILILQRCNQLSSRQNNQVEVIWTSIFELMEQDKQGMYQKFAIPPHNIPQDLFSVTPQNNFAIRMTQSSSEVFRKVFKKLESGELVRLGELVEIQRGIENLKKKDALNSNTAQKVSCRKLIAASNIEKYRIIWNAPQFPHKFVDYDPSNPIYSHINFKQRDWFTQPKIVLKRVSDRLVAALDSRKERESEYYYTMDSVQMLWLKSQYRKSINLRVISAILNSDFMNYYYSTLFSYKQLFSRVQKAFLVKLPIPSHIPKEIQGGIVSLVNQLIQRYDKTIEKTLNTLIDGLYFPSEEVGAIAEYFRPAKTLRDLPGIGAARYWELNGAGITTLEQLIECDSGELTLKIKGMRKATIERWKLAANDLVKSGK